LSIRTNLRNEWSRTVATVVTVDEMTIGPRTLACQTAQQVPITPAGIRTDYAEIQAAPSVCAPRQPVSPRVTGFPGELPAFFAAKLHCRSSINRQHFMGCAVIEPPRFDLSLFRFQPSSKELQMA
jgi:hypothetical protein